LFGWWVGIWVYWNCDGGEFWDEGLIEVRL
jgi:hypothetical protein